jgi:hypothetical protein
MAGISLLHGVSRKEAKRASMILFQLNFTIVSSIGSDISMLHTTH